MTTKKQVPFTVELAKQIQNKEVEGRIVTRGGRPARILCFDRVHATYPILSLVSKGSAELVYSHLSNGKLDDKCTTDNDLIIEVPDNKPQFKPFKKVLVKNSADGIWTAAFFSHYINRNNYPYIVTAGGCWAQCIPYEGNEHLLGTTDKPEED